MRWHRALHLDATCLAIGSMAPDFQYFLRGGQRGTFAHTLPAIALWGIPITIAIALLWQHVVKWPVLVAAPRQLTPVFAASWQPRGVGGWLSAVVSAALGHASHLVWDGVTHANGTFVRWFPALKTSLPLPLLGSMATHRVIQHASTVVGGGIVLAALLLAVRRHASPVPAIRRRGVRLVFAACLAGGVALLLAQIRILNVADLGNVVAASISGLLFGTVVASLFTRDAGLAYRAVIDRSRDPAPLPSPP